jgi:hypothetical protein
MLIWRAMALALILRRALWGGVALGLLFYLALTFWLAHTAIFFPYQLDYGEGIVLWFTRQLALGHSIYKGLDGLPYASSNYPPLGMAFAVPFRALFGDTYIGGRWLNLASAMIVTAFVYRFVREEGTRPAAALSGLFFLGSTFVYHWVPLFRVDLIGLAFTAAGIFFVWRWQCKHDKSRSMNHERTYGPSPPQPAWDLVVAGLFFLAAIYTKHSLVFAPTAAVFAILMRSRRTGIAFAVALGVAAGGIFIALDALTQGGFAFGLVSSNATVWLWSTFQSTTNDFLWTYLVLIAFALWGWVTHLREKRVGILEIYVFAAVVSLGLAGRVGAWENYYFEAIICVCVFAGISLARMGKSGGFGDMLAAPWWLPLLLLIQLALFWREHDPAIAIKLMGVTRSGNQQLAPLVRSQNGIVISEDMGMLVTNEKPVDYYSFQYSSLAGSGQWDQHWEVQNLREGNFPLVILFQGTREDVDHYHDFTREFASALDYGYGLKLENERYKVYEPAPLAHLRGDDFDGQLELVGWSLVPDGSIRSGQTLTLTLVSNAERGLIKRFTAFAHLEDAGGGVVAQDDHEPRVGTYPSNQPYPTTLWAANEMMRDSFALRLPTSLGAGTYSLRVGWYDTNTKDRLSVTGGADYVELAQLDVKP